MNVIGHDYEGMQRIMLQDFCVVPDTFYYCFGNRRLAEVASTGRRFVQEPIHCRERLP